MRRLLPKQIHVLRVDDTPGNRAHSHWRTAIGQLLYWRVPSHEDFGPSIAMWESTDDFAAADIFTDPHAANKACGEIKNFDAVVVTYALV